MSTATPTLSPIRLALGLVAQAGVQKYLSDLFSLYISEMAELGYHGSHIWPCQGAGDERVFEQGLECALWQDGEIGKDCIMLNAYLRFEMTGAKIDRVVLRLLATSLKQEREGAVPVEAALTLPFGKAFDKEQRVTPSYLSSILQLGLKHKCNHYQEGDFRDWVVDALSLDSAVTA